MTMHLSGLAEVVRKDPRFAYEAYEFLFMALGFTQKRLGKVPREPATEAPGPEYHVTGRDLLEGVRDLALREFGLMARTVFRMWGINRTEDFGEIVFKLVDANLMSKTDEDNIQDFRDIFDFDEVLVKDYRIHLEEPEV